MDGVWDWSGGDIRLADMPDQFNCPINKLQAMSTPLRLSQRIAACKAASHLSSDTQQIELQFAACLKLHQASPKPQTKMECKAEARKAEAGKEEDCDTPERKVGVWSQQLDECLTAKKEESSQASQPEQDRFKTPPRRLTIPTLEQLERWDRMERETNRRF